MDEIAPKVLRILFGGKIGYEALLEEYENRLYYRTLGDDKYNCEAMLEELINGEYIEVFETGEINTITLDGGVTCPVNITDSRSISVKTIQELDLYLRDRGLNFQILPNTDAVFTVIFQGRELLPGVASQYDVNKISSVTTSFFQASNNRNYEPRQQKEAGSFKVKVYDSRFEAEGMISLLNDLKAGIISVDRYFEDEKYKRLIKDIEGLSSIKTLNSIKILIGTDIDIDLSMTEIDKIKKKTLDMFKQRQYNAEVSAENIRAFDEKNVSFKIDFNGRTYYAHTNPALFNKIHKAKQDQRIIRFSGVYTKDQSVWIDIAAIK